MLRVHLLAGVDRLSLIIQLSIYWLIMADLCNTWNVYHDLRYLAHQSMGTTLQLN